MSFMTSRHFMTHVRTKPFANFQTVNFMPNGQQSPYKRNPVQLRKFKLGEGNWSSRGSTTHFMGFAHRHKVARM